MNMLKCCKITVVEASAVAGTSTLTTDILDMTGFEGVMFLAMTGDVTNASVLTLTAKANSANSTSSPTPITQATATFTAGASDADDKVLAVDVHKPPLRYVFATLARADQNAVVGGIIAIQYCERLAPVTQHASVIASTFAVGVAS